MWGNVLTEDSGSHRGLSGTRLLCFGAGRAGTGGSLAVWPWWQCWGISQQPMASRASCPAVPGGVRAQVRRVKAAPGMISRFFCHRTVLCVPAPWYMLCPGSGPHFASPAGRFTSRVPSCGALGCPSPTPAGRSLDLSAGVPTERRLFTYVFPPLVFLHCLSPAQEILVKQTDNRAVERTACPWRPRTPSLRGSLATEASVSSAPGTLCPCRY